MAVHTDALPARRGTGAHRARARIDVRPVLGAGVPVLAATAAALTVVWASLVLPRMAGVGTPPTLPGPSWPDFSYVDFRDTMWLPVQDFLGGGVPYDIPAYLARHPQAQEFLLYLPTYFGPAALLQLLPYPVAVVLWLAVQSASLTLLVGYAVGLRRRLTGTPVATPAWAVPALTGLFAATPVVSQPFRSGQLAIPAALGVVLAIVCRHRVAGVLGACVGLVKPPVAVPLVVGMFLAGRARRLLAALAVSLVLAAPVLVVCVVRAEGLGRFLEIAAYSLGYSESSPYGGTGASLSTRTDIVGALARGGIEVSSGVALALTALVLVLASAGLAIAYRRFGIVHPATLTCASGLMTLVAPNELYATIVVIAPLVLAAGLMLRPRPGDPRVIVAALTVLLAVPFVNVHRVHDLLHVPEALSGMSNFLALAAALLVAILWAARPAPAGRPAEVTA